MTRGLLDTSVLIAAESGRPLDRSRMPEESRVCVITVAELEVGVLAAPDTASRQRRLATLQTATSLQPLTITAAVASSWAGLRVQLAQAGRVVPVNDLWIAAVAAAHQLAVVTQDGDFDPLSELGLLEVVRM
jgi:predicted nucleic acid-binding protein